MTVYLLDTTRRVHDLARLTPAAMAWAYQTGYRNFGLCAGAGESLDVYKDVTLPRGIAMPAVLLGRPVVLAPYGAYRWVDAYDHSVHALVETL